MAASGAAGGGSAALLMLADARLPAGGHAHSGGVEAAVAAGLLRTVPDLAVFLRGRLHTAGATAAGLAAAACADPGGCGPLADEADARMPSPAQRAASRQQGRALLRAARAAWPAPHLDALAAVPGGPHHPVALGAVAAAAGADPAGAALVAGYLAVSGPAAAAVRLCGFDPLAVNGLLAALSGAIAEVARAAVAGSSGVGCAAAWAALPAAAAPRLDVLAEIHARTEVCLFAS
jgi:urease accessory protein